MTNESLQRYQNGQMVVNNGTLSGRFSVLRVRRVSARASQTKNCFHMNNFIGGHADCNND